MNSRPGVTAATDTAVLLYEPEAWRPRVLVPATYRSAPHRKRCLRQTGSQFRGLARAIHQISGLR